MINVSNVESRLNSVENLPSLPVVIQQIQKAIANPKNSMAQISNIIEKDQGLSVRTLKLVNSAYYGLREQVTSIKKAIVILGLETLHNLMLGLSVINLFGREKNTVFKHDDFWEHALACAMLSREIGKIAKYEELDHCFISGLLHDVGKLIFEQFLHEEYIRVLEITQKNKKPLVPFENSVFKFNHCDVGAFIAMRWKLPIHLLIVIKYHHFLNSLPPEFLKYKTLLTIVSKSNQLCHLHNFGDSMNIFYDSDNMFQFLKIDSKDIEEIVTNIRGEIKSTLKQWQN
jgi:HD-like signal output (HDOD) protein